jgi:hypothetical protein
LNITSDCSVLLPNNRSCFVTYWGGEEHFGLLA